MNNRGMIWLAAAVAFFAAVRPSLADDKAALAERLHAAEVDTSLDTDGLVPWHLKLEVQLFDAKQQPSEQGTIEEWWSNPKQWVVIYSLPSYSGKLLQNADGQFRSEKVGSVPNLLELLLNQVVHPMPSPQDVDQSVPDLRKETFGKAPLDCIMLTQPIKQVPYPPFGLFPTYCFDPGKDSLRASYDFGSQGIYRNSIGRFQKRSVPVDITVYTGPVKNATAHIATLTGATPDPALYLKSDDMVVAGKMARVGGGVMAGTIISKVQPIYPERARMNRVSGSVVMRAIIGRDGHVHSLRLVTTPDADLAISAVAAVRQWTYKPYLINGEPTEVDTTITVNYNIGP